MPTTSTENNTMTLGDDGANSPVELQLTGDQKLKMTLWLDEKWSVPAIGVLVAQVDTTKFSNVSRNVCCTPCKPG
jgi:hypothetical protein|tara:strand:+ start:234 stop:458 length:225 start_codon:yes stop_codon:yes gene_type:complete